MPCARAHSLTCFPWHQAFTEENFRGIRLWAQIHRELRAARVKTVTPEATAAAVESRRTPGPLDALLGPPPVLLDVREEVYHRKARPEGSVNVPLYKQLVRTAYGLRTTHGRLFLSDVTDCRPAAQTEPKNSYEWARVVSFGLLALRPPVRNEEFIQDVTRLVGGKKARPCCAMPLLSLHLIPMRRAEHAHLCHLRLGRHAGDGIGAQGAFAAGLCSSVALRRL